MKSTSILIIGPAELSGIMNEYPDLASKCELIALTPDAYESGIKNNIQNIKYPDWAQEIRTFDIEEYEKTARLFTKLEAESSIYRQEIFKTDRIVNVDWNSYSNTHISIMINASKKFARKSFSHLKKYKRIYVACLNHVGEFYFDSGLQASIVYFELLKEIKNVELICLDENTKASTYQSRLYEEMPDLIDEKFIQKWNNDKENILIATSAIYNRLDQNKLIEIAKSVYPNTNWFVYPIPLWSVLKPSTELEKKKKTKEVLELLTREERENCIYYIDWLTDKTKEKFKEATSELNLKNNYIFTKQINRLRKRHLLQVLTFQMLMNIFKNKAPKMIATTVQDSSLNGPIISAGKNFETQIMQFPHSRIVNNQTPCECIAITEWWQPKPSTSRWNEKNIMIHFGKPESINNISQVQVNTKWMILYNGVQENLSNFVAWPFMKAVVEYTKKIAEENNIELIHRLKPGDQTPINTYCEILQLDIHEATKNLNKNIQKLFEEVTTVISIDEPSSALWQAVESRCGVIIVADREFTIEALIDDSVLQKIDIEKYKEIIERMASSKEQEKKYSEEQYYKYITKYEKINQ